MRLISRACRSREDLGILAGFLAHCRAQQTRRGYLHVGDLSWRLYRDAQVAARRCIRIWRTPEGGTVGFSFWYPLGGSCVVELQLAPSLAWDSTVAEEMLFWGEGQVRRRPGQAGDGRVLTSVLEGDQDGRTWLETQGYAGPTTTYRHMHSELPLSAPAPQLPLGFKYAAMLETRSFDAWQKLYPGFTLSAYQSMRAAPGYHPELDLVAVAPDGSFVGRCLGWLDDANGVGLLEPVSTERRYRRMGIGKALAAEVCRRFQALGASEAGVVTQEGVEAANALYASSGFYVRTREMDYVKHL